MVLIGQRWLADNTELGVQAQGFDGEKWAEKWAEPYYKDCGNKSYDPSTGQSDCSARGDCTCAFRHEVVEEVADEIYNLGHTAGRQGAGKVVVKPLLWGDKVDYDTSRQPYISKGWSIESRTPFGCYTINYFADTKTYLVQYGTTVISTTCAFVKSAKAAAYEHKQALVLAEIELM